MSRQPLGRVTCLVAGVLLAAACSGRTDNPTEPGETPVVAEGDPAPSFALPAADGGTVALEDFTGKQALLLYFSMGPG